MSLTLTEEQAAELQEEVSSLMCKYNPNPHGSDYMCEFCHNTETPHGTGITHDEDCYGERLFKILLGR